MATTHHTTLEKLNAQAAKDKAAVREAALTAEQAAHAHSGARDAVVTAVAERAKRAETQARTAMAEAETAVAETAIQVEAAERRAAKAQAEAANYLAAHGTELIVELTDRATAARDKLVNSAAQLVEGHAEWHATLALATTYLVASGKGQPRGDMPADHALAPVVREAKRALSDTPEVVLPLPHWRGYQFAREQEADAVKAREQRDTERERHERQRHPVEVITNR